MGTLDYAKDDFSIRKTGLEARFSGGQGGHRFWLYLFNVVASLALFVLIAWLSGNIVVFVICLIAALGAVIFFEVDEFWKRLTAWRRKK